MSTFKIRRDLLGLTTGEFKRFPAIFFASVYVVFQNSGIFHFTGLVNALQHGGGGGKLRYRNGILQPATFFERHVLDSLPLDRSLHYAFDWDFWIRLTRRYNLLVVNEVWAGYRMWGLNKTAVGSAARASFSASPRRRRVRSSRTSRR